jgi:uncharacterized protein with von Willebrand factor type A (vWA) domain
MTGGAGLVEGSRDGGVEAVAAAVTRALRGLGVAAPPDTTVAYAAALAEVGIGRREGAYWAGRATLVHRPEDVPAYDRVFAAVFDGRPLGDDGGPEVVEQVVALVDEDDGGAPEADDTESVEPSVEGRRWSRIELLRDRDFAACSADELAEVHRLMEDLRVVGARRRSRRLRPTRRARGAIDLRATARRSLRSGGEAMRTARRTPGTRLRRVVLLCDVSGSMEAYSRQLVRFAHAAVAGRTQVEAFALGTRCTRITRQLRTHDPDAALAGAARAVVDWSGGTRLGEGVRAFNDTWGMRGMARGAVVVILSDGWDRGDPAVLGQQVARLQRAAHKLVWVNPLKATPGFAPVAQGMAAALPYVDELVEGHSLRSLESLVEVIAG